MKTGLEERRKTTQFSQRRNKLRRVNSFRIGTGRRSLWLLFLSNVIGTVSGPIYRKRCSSVVCSSRSVLDYLDVDSLWLVVNTKISSFLRNLPRPGRLRMSKSPLIEKISCVKLLFIYFCWGPGFWKVFPKKNSNRETRKDGGDLRVTVSYHEVLLPYYNISLVLPFRLKKLVVNVVCRF